MPLSNEIDIYDWKPCSYSIKCLCRRCSWLKYRYDGQYPTLEERKSCLKMMGRTYPLTKNEETERLKRNARKNELRRLKIARSYDTEPSNADGN